MITPEKIEEWIKEVEERPSSAPVILQFIARRLEELSSRNEDLLAENISLRVGERVEEYEQRIAHLEYQLDLLKRQLSGELAPALDEVDIKGEKAVKAQAHQKVSLLIYDTFGRLLRCDINPASLTSGEILGGLIGELSSDLEPPRMLTVPTTEELLFVFTSGRVVSIPLASISPYLPEDADHTELPVLNWKQTSIPVEPHAGEKLACITPISKIALSEFFIQTSRKGFVKKIGTSMSQSILKNHYIGAGVNQPADQAFSVTLCGNEDRLYLVSMEGYLLCLDVMGLPFSTEEAMRLSPSDHIVGAFTANPGTSILLMTQIGKIIQLAFENIDVSDSLKRRGKSALSAGRRKQGVQVIGSAAVNEADWGVALHMDGSISLHAMGELLGSGTIATRGELCAFTSFTTPAFGN